MTLSMALAENGLFELLYKQLTSLKIALAADKQVIYQLNYSGNRS
jgi:hypothetical protein